jgi:hypothetical protein
VAISNDVWLDENGQTDSTDTLLKTLPEIPPTLFVKMNAADYLSQISPHFTESHPKTWQFRTTIGERDIIHPNGTRLATQINVVVHYFGFRGGNFHKIIDPVTMYGRKLDEIWPGDGTRLVKLLEWAVALRDFCHEQNVDIRPTTGGVSAQFLTDKRFYPKARRKVPAKINARARENLPGNHYQLNIIPSPRREWGAWYLDQSRAHHYHARTTRLPDSDSLFAYGYFTDLRDIAFEDTIPEFYGLYCLDLEVPRRGKLWVRNGERAFVWSNELPHLLDSGYRVNGVYAAWGSRRLDTGLARYATWATGQLDRYEDAPWVKPLLLSAYGVLAAKPKLAEAVFRLASKGEPITVVTGHNSLPGLLVRSQKKLEPRIANVLHRGMIEAATRTESIGYSQWLEHLGYRVLSIYADAVIVENQGDKPLPPIPEPWRSKGTLNHLQFINQQAFVSGEMSKLPGVGRELRKYHQQRPGYAPRVVQYEAMTGKEIQTSRRI